MNNASVSLIRKYVHRCLRAINAYRETDLIGPRLSFAMRKYKRHRRLPPDFVYETLQAAYNEHLKKHQERVTDIDAIVE
jgi:hypothetical protein